MIVAANLIRYPRGVAGLRGLNAPGDLVHPDNPCAPGLHLVNGGCFRSPGPSGNPVEGPIENLQTAQQILISQGNTGATCQTEMVDVGPYVYKQNICRDAYGGIIGGADNIAERAFVESSLRTSTGQSIQPVLYASDPLPPVRPPAAPVAPPVLSIAPPVAPHNGSGSKASGQTPEKDPKTVQGSGENSEFMDDFLGDAKAWLKEENSLLILAAVAVGGYFLLKGGR